MSVPPGQSTVGFINDGSITRGVGGDAIRMRDRELSDYQVSILEVAGSADTDEDILRSEHLWIKKLQTVNPHWGLNSNPRGEPKVASPKPA
jgi:hypothetical protein